VIKKTDADQESDDHHRLQEELHVLGIRRRMNPSKSLVLEVKVGSVVEKRVHLVVVVHRPDKRFIDHQETPKNAEKDHRTRVDGFKLKADKLMDLSHQRQSLDLFLFLDVIFVLWNLLGLHTSLSDVCHPFVLWREKSSRAKQKTASA